MRDLDDTADLILFVLMLVVFAGIGIYQVYKQSGWFDDFALLNDDVTIHQRREPGNGCGKRDGI